MILIEMKKRGGEIEGRESERDREREREAERKN